MLEAIRGSDGMLTDIRTLRGRGKLRTPPPGSTTCKLALSWSALDAIGSGPYWTPMKDVVTTVDVIATPIPEARKEERQISKELRAMAMERIAKRTAEKLVQNQ